MATVYLPQPPDHAPTAMANWGQKRKCRKDHRVKVKITVATTNHRRVHEIKKSFATRMARLHLVRPANLQLGERNTTTGLAVLHLTMTATITLYSTTILPQIVEIGRCTWKL